MRLKARYAFNVPGVGVVAPGAEFDVPDEIGVMLLSSQYAHFDRIALALDPKAMDAPPVDKMMKRAYVRRKGRE